MRGSKTGLRASEMITVRVGWIPPGKIPNNLPLILCFSGR